MNLPITLTLEENRHWRHFPSKNGKSKHLAVFYSPAQIREPRLPYFKKSAELDCGRLLISPFNDEFYQDCISSVLSVLSDVSAEYEKTIHYGYSMGAYAALRFGSVDPKCVAIFAMSPHLVLDRRYSRSALLMSGPVSPPDNDVRPFVAANDKRTFLAISCFDVLDGVQVSDARAMASPNLEKHFVLERHELDSLNNPVKIISEFLSDGSMPKVNPEIEASDRDVTDCISAHKFLASTESNVEVKENVPLSSKIPQYHYWYARNLTKFGKDIYSLPWFMRAFSLAKMLGLSASEYAITMANVMSDVQLHEPALGFYRQFQNPGDSHPQAYFCEAALLQRLNRVDELKELVGRYERSHGSDGLLERFKNELQSA